jgi:CAAX protease family protein
MSEIFIEASPQPLGQDEPTTPAQLESAPSSPAPRKPRVWTVFVTFVVTIAAIFAVQIGLAVGLLLWVAWQGRSIQQAGAELIEWAETPEFFLFAGIPTQLTLLLMSLAAARFSPEPMVARLGLQRPRASAWRVAVWVAGAIVPFLVGLGAAQWLATVIPPDPTVARLYEHMHWQIAAPFILFIAVAPGICEEILFRGYMQRRLTQRWGMLCGVLVTSVLFGLMHIMPHAVVFAGTLGVWLGLMAWRTDSIWPSAVCHALVNGLWNVWNIGVALLVFPSDFPLPLFVAIVAVGVAAFAIACWDLATLRRQEAVIREAEKTPQIAPAEATYAITPLTPPDNGVATSPSPP